MQEWDFLEVFSPKRFTKKGKFKKAILQVREFFIERLAEDLLCQNAEKVLKFIIGNNFQRLSKVKCFLGIRIFEGEMVD